MSIGFVLVVISTALLITAFITDYQVKKIHERLDRYEMDTREINERLSYRITHLENQIVNQVIHRAYENISVTSSKKVDPYICRYCHRPLIPQAHECQNCGAPINTMDNDLTTAYFKDAHFHGNIIATNPIDPDEIRKTIERYAVWEHD